MIDPLDNATVKFFLQFEDNAPIEIAEPIKFDAANFVIKQDDKRMARDVSFAGGKANLRFSPMVNFRGMTHQFEKLITTYKTNGFESDVKFILEIDGEIYVIGQLDFAEAETDLLTYFDCKIIQDNKEALIKRRSKVKIDLFSDKDLDGNPIEPLATEKLYLRATPITQISKWGMVDDEPKYYPSPSMPALFFNPAPVIKESGIEDTLSPSSEWMQLSNDENPALEDYVILEAANTLKNCVLKVSGKWDFTNCIGLDLRIKKGVDFASSEYIYDNYLNEVENNFQLEVFIPVINRDERLYLFFLTESINPSNSVFYSFDVEMKVNSISLSSVIESFNLGSAMAQVVKSISGIDIDAPRFMSEDGDFKKQYITDGLRIRNIIDQPFYISLDDIADYLPEIRGDYEVGEDNVFFGIFRDFYRDEKIGSFNMLPSEDFQSSFNKEYSINTFDMKYAKYSNDNEADGSREAVHCKLQLMLPNKMVENNKSVNIGFIRDSFMLENTRKKAIEVKEDTVTSNDGEIFIIDCIKKNINVEEVMTLNHSVMQNGNLRLLNDSTFNWLLSGATVGDPMLLGITNAGGYYILELTETTITLEPRRNTTPSFSGLAPTRIIFDITETNLTNRTNEGFDFLEGASTPEGFSNLLFTPKRNIYNYWSNYLMTATMFQKTKEIKMMEFLYNRELKTAAFGVPPFIVTEGKDISYTSLETMEDIVLTPYLVKTQIICDFPVFWKLRQNIRTKRGYIEMRTNENELINIYPKELDFDWAKNILTIEGERKF